MGEYRRSKIGGQAVLEGVMMRGETSMATAVRAPDKQITVESQRLKSANSKSVWKKIPVVRGVLTFFSMMYLGVGIIMRSAEVMGEEFEPSKFEKWFAEKTKLDLMKVAMVVAVILGICFAVALFVLLPEFLVSLLFRIPVFSGAPIIIKNLVTGIVRICIFVLYVALCTRMNDIKRLFMYHGAEHKTINAYEHGEELTVENVQKYTTVHTRCGTTFIFLVMIISILIFSALSFLPGYADSFLFRVLYKLLFLPFVAGISYEVQRFLAMSDNLFFRIIRAPGLWLQKLTTKQPDNGMVEVAIKAFTTVQKMDANQSLPETKFEIRMPMAVLKKKLAELLPDSEFEAADIDWIICEVAKIGRAQIATTDYLLKEQFDAAIKLAEERATHKPLQYVLGYTEFCGHKISVDKSVLIPRPETELLAEKVIKMAEGKTVWDLCTGSGAIAVAVAADGKPSEVFASDISDEALEKAKLNAEINGVIIKFGIGNIFDAAIEKKVDIIVGNPPYIPTSEIERLQKEVAEFEPKVALDGGPDGLDFYRIIAAEGKSHLNDDGVICLEIGVGQRQAIEKIFDNYNVEFSADYNGIERILIAK